MVDFEADILLAWARSHRAARKPPQACQQAEEALTIAERCGYRLVQADAHNTLAQLALDDGDRAAAQRHAEIARERVWCDGPPHCYKPRSMRLNLCSRPPRETRETRLLLRRPNTSKIKVPTNSIGFKTLRLFEHPGEVV
jgi:hypothetical protein